MKRKIFPVILLLFGLSSHSFLHAEDSTEKDLIISLRYPKAYNIKLHEFKKNKTTQVSYKVKAPYPSYDVLSFYDNELRKLEWKRFNHPYFNNLRKWDSVWDGTIKGKPLTHRLISFWINSEKTEIATLMLQYISNNLSNQDILKQVEPNNDVQHVILQVGPYSEFFL